MKKLRNFYESKKGAASLYAVIFATILFGVITLSYVRIILSEARQSGDDELSQSAYDSALAGVEDAKRAVNKYYACINSEGDATKCSALYPFDDSCENFSSSTKSNFKKALNYTGAEGEIKVQESSTAMGKGEGNETFTDQAYTCVTMSTQVEDYRSTLTNDTRVRVVPLGVESNKLQDVGVVEFKWFSENNATNLQNLYDNKALKKKNDTSNVPVISLTLLATNREFNVGDFNTSTNNDNVIYSTMVLLPSASSNDEAVSSIDWTTIRDAGNSDSTHTPFLVKCDVGEFACSIDLQINNQLFNDGNAMLIVSMPYGETVSDLAVTMYKDASKKDVIPFEGVQISVDSTGRANQLYRRVETRLDPVDNYFPYPQFAAELDGDSDAKLLKNFWITYNCWTNNGACPNNGQLQSQ